MYFVLLNYAVVFTIIFPYISGSSCEFGYLVKTGQCKVIFRQPQKAPCLKYNFKLDFKKLIQHILHGQVCTGKLNVDVASLYNVFNDVSMVCATISHQGIDLRTEFAVTDSVLLRKLL